MSDSPVVCDEFVPGFHEPGRCNRCIGPKEAHTSSQIDYEDFCDPRVLPDENEQRMLRIGPTQFALRLHKECAELRKQVRQAEKALSRSVDDQTALRAQRQRLANDLKSIAKIFQEAGLVESAEHVEARLRAEGLHR